MVKKLIIKNLVHSEYDRVYDLMARLTEQRNEKSQDECWHLQHSPVFTLGLGGKESHVINPGDIPVIRTDRGGQVTYHGPGQLIIYLMIDLRRKGMTVKRFVHQLEQTVINMCCDHDIDAERHKGAPGVFVGGRKIAALGIRIRRGCSYHGLALNVDMDLSPYSRINPCGTPGLQVTQLSDLGCKKNVDQVFASLLPHLLKQMGYAGHHQMKASQVSIDPGMIQAT